MKTASVSLATKGCADVNTLPSVALINLINYLICIICNGKYDGDYIAGCRKPICLLLYVLLISSSTPASGAVDQFSDIFSLSLSFKKIFVLLLT